MMAVGMSILYYALKPVIQSSTAIMPRMPIVIFSETVVAGAILFLSPLLKSTAPHCPAFAPFENNPEQHRAQQLKQFGSTAEKF
jgi:hypothetical protein